MKFLLILFIIAGNVTGLLQVNQLSENNGYADIKIRDVEIVNTTNTVIHIIDINELLKTLDILEENINTVDLSNKQVLLDRIQILYDKVRTIIPKQGREKRGLINFVGTAQKWLYGTMDDDDRNEILGHLSIIDENNRNLIKTVNKQVIINDSFNKSLINLKDSLEQDRASIKSAFQQIRKSNNEIVRRLLYLDQLSKLNIIENKIEQIQDNIASAKNNFIHPSIFTKKEIEIFNIDFYKLKLLKIGIMTYKDNAIIIAIQIPDMIITTQLRLITPIPNKDHLEIDYPDETIIEINNIILHYEENKILRHLKRSNHCSIRNNCKYSFNNETDVKDIDDETVLLINVRKEYVKQTCDNRNLRLTGNYLLSFNNCNITIANLQFTNKKHVIREKFFYPPSRIINITKHELKFDKIILEHTNNIQEINELKVHSKVSYGLNFILIIIVISAFVLIYFILKKNKVTVKLNETQNITIPNVSRESLNAQEIVHKYISQNK